MVRTFACPQSGALQLWWQANRTGLRALNVIPFVDPTVGVVVFTAASILKDAVNRFGDLLDDG